MEAKCVAGKVKPPDEIDLTSPHVQFIIDFSDGLPKLVKDFFIRSWYFFHAASFIPLSMMWWIIQN